jgi:hypothetical protein
LARLETLKKLEATLERFLDKVVASEGDRVDIFGGIDSLDDIARDSLKGRLINRQLGRWFARHNRLVDNAKLEETEVSSIANLLGEIRAGLDSNDPETRKLSEEIERWKDKGIVPKRKLVLKLKSEKQDQTITDKFRGLLKQEKDYLDFEQKSSDHLLTILDDVLKSADAKEDTMFIHLAGSIIYFLKMNGYKVEPFVKRLKEIERNKAGSPNVA